jgi:hypothetical protein
MGAVKENVFFSLGKNQIDTNIPLVIVYHKLSIITCHNSITRYLVLVMERNKRYSSKTTSAKGLKERSNTHQDVV